jgi:hypothetical protein
LGLGADDYEFDAGRKEGAFEPHAKRYQDLARLVLTLATASAAFLLSFLVNIDINKQQNSYSTRLEAVFPFAMAFLCLSAGSCLTFMLFHSIYYEAASRPAKRRKVAGNVYSSRDDTGVTFSAKIVPRDLPKCFRIKHSVSRKVSRGQVGSYD